MNKNTLKELRDSVRGTELDRYTQTIYRPLVYLAGPISAPTIGQGLENITRGCRWGTVLALQGYAPIVPFHDHYFTIMARIDHGEHITPAMYYQITAKYLEKADIMFVIPTDDGIGTRWQDSTGVLNEINRAVDRRIPVVLEDDTLLRTVTGAIGMSKWDNIARIVWEQHRAVLDNGVFFRE